LSTLPLGVGLDAMRQLAFRDMTGVLPVGVEMAILVAMGIVFIIGARLALGYLEHLARKEGRLTLRWQ
jgi:hypothetical protein